MLPVRGVDLFGGGGRPRAGEAREFSILLQVSFVVFVVDTIAIVAAVVEVVVVVVVVVEVYLVVAVVFRRVSLLFGRPSASK